MIWREDQIELLKSLRVQGHSFDSIALTMHTSRNAIAGKCKRLGLCCPKVKGHTQVLPRSKVKVHPEAEVVFEPFVDLLPAPRPSHQTERQREMYEDLRRAVENTR